MKTYVVIHNKNSRGRNLKEEYINKLFESNNLKYIYEATNSFEELDQKIKLYNDSSKYQYCTIGGDGSLNALVNSLMINNISNPEVSVLPAGSGSDFIRTFAIPQKIEEAISHLCTENYYEVDVGLVRNHNQSSGATLAKPPKNCSEPWSSAAAAATGLPAFSRFDGRRDRCSNQHVKTEVTLTAAELAEAPACPTG